MGCAPCEARANRLREQKFAWTDGTTTVVYPTEAGAKTKVRKVGGTYAAVPPPVA